MSALRSFWFALAIGTCAFLPGGTREAPPVQQHILFPGSHGTALPVVRELRYQVNGRARPLLLFWIRRDNIGDAWLRWGQSPDGRQALSLLVGSDPARAPRKINRWGFIVEQWQGDRTDVLGAMTESDEQTIEEAEARIGTRAGDAVAFKASRSTITGDRAVGGTMTIYAPPELTYRTLDTLLGLIPSEAPVVRTLVVPAGTRNGFLVSMESLLRDSVAPCVGSAGARSVPAVAFVYKQTMYDLALTSCELKKELRTSSRVFTDVVKGDFRVTNHSTKEQTTFSISYGSSGDLRALPVHATLRPRWWLELELDLQPGQKDPPPSHP